MKTQHERIKWVSDWEVHILRWGGGGRCVLRVGRNGGEVVIALKPAVNVASCDTATLEALQLAISCYRQTGSFTALRADNGSPCGVEVSGAYN